MMRAKKSFGQHFLVEETIAQRLADALDTVGSEAVIEVGPGKGILTKYLLRQPLPVYAVELDRDMIPILKKEFAGTPLHIIQDDILRLHIHELLGANTSFVLVGNNAVKLESMARNKLTIETNNHFC